MKVLPKPIAFEWDKGNIGKNQKHNITDRESEEPFILNGKTPAFMSEMRVEFSEEKRTPAFRPEESINRPNFSVDDEKHSKLEKRSMLWGITNNSRKLSIIYTIRNNKQSFSTSKVRIISARDMSKKERGEYEEKIKANT